MRKSFLGGLLLLPAVTIAAALALWDGTDDRGAALAALPAEKLLQVPAVDYRKDWVQLGTFSILSDEPDEGAEQLHVVYTAPANVEAYRQTGAFPDGTVLVKDVLATRTEDLTTGTVSFGTHLVGRFVMVKDAAGTHGQGSPLWGDGWGWAFYEGIETTETVTTDYRTDCLGCHEPVRHQDLIYIQGYPVLSR